MEDDLQNKTAGHLSEQSRSQNILMIAVLALLPENDVRRRLENLKEITDEMPLRTIPLIEYVERVYVGSEGSPARFPRSTWNVHLQTL